MSPLEVAELIERGLAGSRASVTSPDNVHFDAVVIAERFAGLRALQRHQLVYATLGPAMGNEIHALALKALTPEEYASQVRG
ncbi:MAG TPA: BolA/IbaG family iron-sulfur metabolism protein [Steroidobacteraceae bacterium]|nr:BolA/IbaG family iron-sulfur metabolism protein [Steroidobacteraceae bacterium]